MARFFEFGSDYHGDTEPLSGVLRSSKCEFGRVSLEGGVTGVYWHGPKMNLSVILTRCKAGDALAWEALVRHFQSRIYGIAYHYVGNTEDARDLAQEVFVRIYQNLQACEDAGMFLPWIIRIARNACIDHLRRRKSRSQGKDVALEEVPNLQDPGNTPEQQWAANSRKRLIYRALKELTDLNREIILLKEIQGLQLDEIASLLKVPLGTVKSRSNRARIELARKVMALSGE
ncbi:MAG: sigma-70 family RNA polymerase sigma factor [Acidobacteriota bacterium]